MTDNDARVTTAKSTFKPTSIWHMAWPSILTYLFYTLSSLAQIKIINPLGAEPLAALMTSHRYLFVIQSILTGLTAATTACVARSWGQQKKDEARLYTSNSLVAINLAAIALNALLVIVPDFFIGWFELTPSAADDAAMLLRWTSLANIIIGMVLVLTAALRAAGDSITPLLLAAANALTTIVFVYWLVHGGLGVPALGLIGLPLGYGLSLLLCDVAFFGIWVKGSLRIGAQLRGFWDTAKIREIFSIGIPAAAEQAVLQIGLLLFTVLLSRYDTAPYAAYGVGVSLMLISIVVGFGFSIAASTLVGQYIGAGQPEQAKRSGWSSARMALISMTVFSLIIAAFAEPIARFMVADDEVVHYTVIFMYMLAAVQPLMGIEMTLGGALRGAGDTRFPLFSTAFGLIAGRILLAYIFIEMGLSVEWVYGALIADYVIKAVLIIWRYQSGRWLRKF